VNYTEQDISRLASFPAQNPNPVMEVDFAAGEITYMNPAGQKRFPEIGKTKFGHPLFDEVKKQLASRKDFECEVALGDTIFEQKVYFIADTDLIRVYSSDITKIRLAEKNMSRLATFPELNPSPIIEVNLEFEVTYFNPAARIHFPDLEAKRAEHPVLQRLKAQFPRFKSGEIETHSDEFRYGDIYYDQRSRIIKESQVIRMFNLDITQMKRAEEIIKEKNKDITDSINYAKRIQGAILPSENLLTEPCPDSFVLYKPKDIISGDFYWFTSVNDYFLFACADCTGHGVPGALMSMIGSNFITHIVNEKEIKTPSDALLELDQRIRKALKQDEEKENKDGMDIAFCSYDLKKKILHYSGANRPLAILRKGELIEYSPSKYSIGGEYNPLKKFEEHKIELQKGDCIYCFTDGITDQFGGPRGKKFMKKNLFNVLLEINSKPMPEQKDILNSTLEKWRGNLEQVDDILIMGIRVG
jgi:serine phosphatase RsbU (regulator of sigma subunit)